MENKKYKIRDNIMETLIWDLDGTIIHTLYKYRIASSKCITTILESIIPHTMSIQEIDIKHSKIDTEDCIKKGFGNKNRFSNSWIKTYKTICNEKNILPNENSNKSIKNNALSCFRNDIIFIDYAEEVLDYLKDKYNMYLFTMGSYDIQYEKIIKANLFRFFNLSNIFITKDKNIKTWKKILDFVGDHAITSIIGDSLRSDIYPAIKLGLKKAIYFESEPWLFSICTDIKYIEDSERFYKIKNLKEIFNILEGK